MLDFTFCAYIKEDFFKYMHIVKGDEKKLPEFSI